MRDIHIRKAVVHVQLPLACSTCSNTAWSDPIKVEVEHDVGTEGLIEILTSQKLGTRFPIGWANYSNKLICPDCPHP